MGLTINNEFLCRGKCSHKVRKLARQLSYKDDKLQADFAGNVWQLRGNGPYVRKVR